MTQSKEFKQRIFLIFPSFLNLNIKLLGNLRGNSYAKFILLEIKSRFTCDESNIYWKVALFHYIISAIVFCSTCIIWIEKITSSCRLYELVVCVWMDLPQIQYFCFFFLTSIYLKKEISSIGVVIIQINPNLSGLFRDSFWGGGRIKLPPLSKSC